MTLAFTMHKTKDGAHGGAHEFLVQLRTNDVAAPERSLIVRSFWGPR